MKLLHFNYTKCTQKQKIALAFPVNPKHPDRLLLNDKYNPKYSKISTFQLVKVNSKFSPYNRVNQKIRNIFCLYSLNLKIHDWSLLILPNFYPFTYLYQLLDIFLTKQFHSQHIGKMEKMETFQSD